MNVNKILLALGIACGFTMSVKSQTTLNVYPINGAIGVKFFAGKKVSLEPRFDVQFDRANGESNVFINTEAFTTVNFLREEKFVMYSGIGLGANIYNQAQSNFSGSVPLGATYYIGESKRIGIVGECGLRVTAYDFIKIKSYALIGLQIRLQTLKAATQDAKSSGNL